MAKRNTTRKVVDFLTFPFRCVALFEEDRCGLSSLASERFDYVAREVRGFCLDVGCGRDNRFVKEFLHGHGRGIDVYPYRGLTSQEIVEDITRFPFPDSTFDTVTFIANLNHVPRRNRDIELKEAHRVLRPEGKLVITMGFPLAEIAVHELVWVYDRVLRTHIDMDSERGMDEEEEYYVTDTEIRARLLRAGFRDPRRQNFTTQWGLNHLIVATKA